MTDWILVTRQHEHRLTRDSLISTLPFSLRLPAFDHHLICPKLVSVSLRITMSASKWQTHVFQIPSLLARA
jgi:hypothetical protein